MRMKAIISNAARVVTKFGSGDPTEQRKLRICGIYIFSGREGYVSISELGHSP